MKKDWKWTLVQHSGFGFGYKLQFRLAVEERIVEGPDIERVRKAGGVLFETYEEAMGAEELENYPPGVEGLIPRVRGTFHRNKVKGLAIYLPDPKLGLVKQKGTAHANG